MKTCPLCVFISAPDRIRRERALRFILGHFAGKDIRPLSYSFTEQGRQNISSLLREISEPSLFEPTRYVIIRGIDTAKVVDLEPLTNFMNKRIEGVHIILVGEGFPQSQNFKKAVEKLGTILAFEPLKGAELRRWTERELKQGGVAGATDEMVELALSLAAEEPEAIAALIEKLSLYLDGDTPTTEVMRKLIPGRSSASDFELADALMNKKRAPTEVLIHQLISQGSSPFMLLGLLTKTFMTLYRIRASLDKGLQQQDIRTSLGISPWLFNRYVPIARTQTLKALSSHCESLLRADFRLKDKSLGHGAIFSTLASHISQRA
ncbi:MAG: polymerase delta subunit [Pseudomonadota bacterium]